MVDLEEALCGLMPTEEEKQEDDFGYGDKPAKPNRQALAKVQLTE